LNFISLHFFLAKSYKQMITLTSQDKQSFQVDITVAQRSLLLKNLLEDVGESDSPIP
jgi:S-phase kinase-associated protein 1